MGYLPRTRTTDRGPRAPRGSAGAPRGGEIVEGALHLDRVMAARVDERVRAVENGVGVLERCAQAPPKVLAVSRSSDAASVRTAASVSCRAAELAPTSRSIVPSVRLSEPRTCGQLAERLP